MRIHLVFPALLLLAVCTVAAADPALLSQRDARAEGERLLGEGKFDDAIAAFAQCAKCWPAPDRWLSSGDPRTEALLEAFDRTWRKLDDSPASDERRLALCDFCVNQHPFFGISDPVYGDPSFEGWLDLLGIAMEIRIRRADPTGNDPRFAVCRSLKALDGDDAAEPLLAILEGDDWPEPHEDCGVCAFRAFRVLDAWVKREPIAPGSATAERAWRAFSRRFQGSRLLVAAALTWNGDRSVLESSQDPTILRWMRTSAFAGLSSDDKPEVYAEALQRLADVSGPWFNHRLAAAWSIAQRVYLMSEHPEQRVGLMVAWRAMKAQHAGTLEFGLASFHIEWIAIRMSGQLVDVWLQDYLREWAEAAPGDPFLAWGRWQRLERRFARDFDARLSSAERADVEDLAARFPTESIGAFSQWLLAEDDVRKGQGDAALARYRHIAAFDVDGIRLPAANDPVDAVGAARERLAAYYRIRDPRRVPEFMRNPLYPSSPHSDEGGVCGNAVTTAMRNDIHAQTAGLAGAGKVDEALAKLWENFPHGSVNGPDFEGALQFADLCAETDRVARIGEAIDELHDLARQDLVEHPNYPTDTYGEHAEFLAGYLADLEAIPLLDAAGLERRIERLPSVDPKVAWDAYLDDPHLKALLHIARRVPKLVAEVTSHLTTPASCVSLALARVAPEAHAQAYALDTYLATRLAPNEDPPLAQKQLAQRLLYENPAEALRIIFERVLRDGPAIWAEVREVVHRCFPEADQWTVYRAYRDDADPAIRDLVGMECKELRRRAPWAVYCADME